MIPTNVGSRQPETSASAASAMLPPAAGDYEETVGGGVIDAPVLVHQSDSTIIYGLHTGTFIKVARDPQPSQEQITRLLQEQNVAAFLPESVRKREVLGISDFNGRTAVEFKWANGITIEEWLQKVDRRSDSTLQEEDFTVRVRAAMAIAKTLADFHDNGVVYNSLNTRDIVLSPTEEGYSATFIDLSRSVIVSGDDFSGESIDKVRAKENDLRTLGKLLYQVFGGSLEDLDPARIHSDYGDDGFVPTRKRGKHQLLREGLPIYLGSLISALLDHALLSTGVCYSDARDVYHDMKVYVDDASGQLGRIDLDDDMMTSRLRLPQNMFYGRQAQMSLILHLFQTSIEFGNVPVPQMAMISGCPGSGKSTLVDQLKQPLIDLGGCFIEGKFDKAMRPDTVLATALDRFFGGILETSKFVGNVQVSLRWRIHDILGSTENNPFLEMLPNLKAWLSEDSSQFSATQSNDIIGMGSSGLAVSSQRVKYLFCKLIGAMASRSSPLILFLDDLQWADETTLDIARMIMTDPDITHFLFLGSYRDTEVNRSHPLLSKLNTMEEQGVTVVDVKVGPIQKEVVNTMISEILYTPPSLCRPLSSIIHSKTGGVIMFILRFLQTLNADDKLWFNMGGKRWMYDLDKIRHTEIQDDVVSHMTHQMARLSKDMRMGLMFAACLGRKFPSSVLAKATKHEVTDAFTQTCIDYGFFQLDDVNVYMWQHDQVQQAAYELIPKNKQDSYHLLIGTRLYMDTPDEKMKDLIFFVVDNMNHGVALINDHDKRTEVAQLNLQAGEKALSSSAFQSASEYLLAGISFLDTESWSTDYDLALRLYDAASEALFVVGEFDTLMTIVEEPLRMAKCFEDKLNLYNNMIRTHSCTSMVENGISTCLSIISQLGEDFPTEITAEIYHREAQEVKRLLHGKTKNDLLSLPTMTDSNSLGAMHFLSHLLSLAFNTRPALSPIAVFRLVRMTLRKGMCNNSAFAFACYAGWLVSDPVNDVEAGYYMGKISVEMMQRQGCTDATARIYALVYGFINIKKEPWQAGLDKHLAAFEVGSQVGDMEGAFTNIFQHYNASLFGCGHNLIVIAEALRNYTQRAFQCKQIYIWKSLACLLQLSHDLMGIKDNAFTPHFTEETCYQDAKLKKSFAVCRGLVHKRKYIAILTGDVISAATLYNVANEYTLGSIGLGRQIHMMVGDFVDGLLGFLLGRKYKGTEESTKWMAIGCKCLDVIKGHERNSDWNFANKMHLLEAEYYFCIDNHENAVASYRQAIISAQEHRFCHEEGLAEEKLATYLMYCNQSDAALHHFTNAKKAYTKWGAKVLADRISKAMAILAPLCSRGSTAF
mmetsp:Transcript_37175/g.83539  ORF Transcript_37175/g.83539 Transcript_37175/m.83539 type:complete len:1332 (+) Transcript_37175:185-4180(+)